jgi:hypothetical protein
MSADYLAELRRTTRRGLALAQQWRLEDQPAGGVGNAARVALGQAVTAMVLGMEDDAWPVVRRARDWLAEAEVRHERQGDRPAYFAAVRAEALGLATWLLGEDPGDAFARACRRHDPTWDVAPELVRDCLLAGQPAIGAELYRRLGGPPAIADAVETPLELAGWLCDGVSRLQPPASWVAVAERVLRGVLADWIDRGHGVEAGLWLALAYGASGATLTPGEAVRRGAELVGARPTDPLARVLRESLGDPVDVDLFTGFLATVGAVALPEGTRLTAELLGHASVTVVAESFGDDSGLDREVAAALAAPYAVGLAERLAAAVRGRLLAPDGETPVSVARVSLSLS